MNYLKLKYVNVGIRPKTARHFLLASVAASACLLIGVGSGSAQTYTYDNLGRLTKGVNPDGGQITYTYDAANNRTEVDRASGNLIQITAISNLRTKANTAGYTGSTPVSYSFQVASATTLTGSNGGGAVIDTGTWLSGATLGLIVDGTVNGGSSSGDSGLYVQSPINVTLHGTLNKIKLVSSGTTLGFSGKNANGTGPLIEGGGSQVFLSGVGTIATITGNLNTVSALAGHIVTLGISNPTWDYADEINLSSGTLKVNDYSLARIYGSASTVNMGYATSLAVFGDGNVVNGSTYTNGGYYGAYYSTGANNSFTVAGSTVTFNNANTTGTVGGFNNNIYGATGDTLSISNPGASWDYANNLTMTSGTVNLAANSQMRLYGTGNTVAMGNSASIYLDGANTTLTGGLYGTYYLGGTNQTINASGVTIYFNNTNTSASIIGQNNTINGQAGSVITTTQTQVNWDLADNVVMSNGTLNVTAGSVVRLNGVSDTVSMGANAILSATVNNSTLTTGSGILLYLTGDSDTVNGQSGSTLYVSGTGVTVNISGSTIHKTSTSTVTVNGTGNTVVTP